MSDDHAPTEIERLEQIWRGDFGDEYVTRNLDTYAAREPFWSAMIASRYGTPVGDGRVGE